MDGYRYTKRSYNRTRMRFERLQGRFTLLSQCYSALASRRGHSRLVLKPAGVPKNFKVPGGSGDWNRLGRGYIGQRRADEIGYGQAGALHLGREIRV